MTWEVIEFFIDNLLVNVENTLPEPKSIVYVINEFKCYFYP